MTEVDVATALPVTPLAEALTEVLLHSHPRPGVEPQLEAYLGVETLRHLDAPEAESSAIFRGAAMHDLGWLRRIAVRGEDRSRWLSGMVTNAVETLADGHGAYNLVLNAQGRIQGDAMVWRDGEALAIETTANQLRPLLEHFDRFIIMDDVELVEETGELAIGLTGPGAAGILKAAGLGSLAASLTEENMSGGGALPGADGGEGIPIRVFRGHGRLVPHYAIWAEGGRLVEVWQALEEAGAVGVGSAAVETLRVVEGIPAYGVDIQSRDLAQETGQDRALNFSKGCYVGQEIVERIRSRGQVHRHLRSLEIELDGGMETSAPAAGSELRAAGAGAKPLGTLTSVAKMQLGAATRIFAIGMVRAEAELVKGPLNLAVPQADVPASSARAALLKGLPKFD